MANYRFTKSDREGIVRRAIEVAFADRDAALGEAEHALGIACYEHFYSAEVRAQANAMPQGWLADSKRVDVTFSYRRMTLNLKYTVRLPYDAHYGVMGTVKDQALNDRFGLLENLRLGIKQDKATAEAKLTAMIFRFSSFNALAEAWPEGVEFYKHLTPKEAVALPAIQIDSINAMLGLKAAA